MKKIILPLTFLLILMTSVLAMPMSFRNIKQTTPSQNSQNIDGEVTRFTVYAEASEGPARVCLDMVTKNTGKECYIPIERLEVYNSQGLFKKTCWYGPGLFCPGEERRHYICMNYGDFKREELGRWTARIKLYAARENSGPGANDMLLDQEEMVFFVQKLF